MGDHMIKDSVNTLGLCKWICVNRWVEEANGLKPWFWVLGNMKKEKAQELTWQAMHNSMEMVDD